MKKGIDVSYANGNVNWEKAKQQVDFAIIRCGFGMDIVSQDDKQFKRNIEECIRLDIPFGVYIYSYANTIQKAESEAEHVLRLIANYRDKIKLHIWYDIEDQKLSVLSKDSLSNIIITFCNKISENGLSVGIYASNSWLRNKIDMKIQDKYMIWAAGYGKNDGQPHQEAKYNHANLLIWQYSSNGNVDGVGRCDVNYYYGEEIAQQNQEQTTQQEARKSNEEIAKEVIEGKWGDQPERERKIRAAGYDYDVIQQIVNEELK